MRVHADLIIAGFRRYSTYRQAMLAGMTTNVVFGLLRAAVLTAAVRTASGTIAAYDIAATYTYVWLGQGLLGFVLLWGDTTLATRVRTGDVVVDLYRPWNLQTAMLAEDVGRAGYAVVTRLVPPIAFGALLFPFRWPEHPLTWPLFVVSALLALVTCYGVRFLINLATFWLLDNRGLVSFWNVTSGLLCGMVVPVAFYPGWAQVALWATPFPALLQAPINVFLERDYFSLAHQAFWAVALLVAGHLVLRRAVRKVVVQGG
ncbi:ABC-2 family transporter protein [Lentzea sp. NBRC 105346]|uniref:ABC transporter permease n=1 Tax=Lentzea sp. NBRC 105346 TaxID=3032205 RepID=UPI002553B41A|nr:ABC-2 family transporter protein [Lentzea sp. NBRC 105346]